MPDTTAKILARGTNATGITEALAEKLHDQLGKTIVAVVEITSENRSESVDGKQKVNLKLGMIEVAPNDDTEDHLRELARAFHYERKLDAPDGQLAIDTRDDLEPKVADVIAEGAKRRPHDFTPAPENKTVCDVCGQGEKTSLHAAGALGAGDDETGNDAA